MSDNARILTDRPAVSIIVPVYKVEPYLPMCIESILAQTFSDFELILVDDGSPDNCPRICDEYARQDKRVKVIHQQNRGVSAARNAGLEVARGEYIGFIDPDDNVEQDCISALVELIDDNHIGYAMCGYCIETGAGEVAFRTPQGDEKCESGCQAALKLIFSNAFHGSCWNKLYRRSVIEKNKLRFDTELYYCEDLLFNCAYLSKIQEQYAVAHTSKALYRYIKRANGVTTQKANRKTVTRLNAIEKMLKQPIVLECRDICAELKRSYVELASVYLRQGDVYTEQEAKTVKRKATAWMASYILESARRKEKAKSIIASVLHVICA